MTTQTHKTLIVLKNIACLLGMVCIMAISANAQFAPQAGNPGSTAIHRDSSILKTWATACTIQRGWQNIADSSLGLALVGDSSYIPGKPGNGIASLGDGGVATVTFYHPIQNGSGYDFVVFENGFIDQSLDTGTAFLELAFVEVSSDGIHYFKFPAQSLTDTATQVGSFSGMRADKIHNLAGKYIAPFGTPFDLDELPDTSLLDKNAVTHVRITDVVGSIDNRYATVDVNGNKINDPWPTPFASGGFDLDAVGVIHPNYALSTKDVLESDKQNISCFPVPASTNSYIQVKATSAILHLIIFDQLGRLVPNESEVNTQVKLREKGIYTLRIQTENGTVHHKLQIW